MSPTCLVFVGLLLFAATNGDATEQKEVRNKRNRRSLVNMNNMWKELTGTEGTKFINYGNWCGLGGGGEPVDALDGCCQSHDLCYHEIEQTACKNEGTKALYGKNYYYKIEDGIVTCVWSNKVKFGGYFKKKRRGGRRRRKNSRVIRDINSTYQLPNIEDKNGEACESSLCLCDVVLGNCLKNNHHLYNNENYHPISVYDAIMSGQYIKSLL